MLRGLIRIAIKSTMKTTRFVVVFLDFCYCAPGDPGRSTWERSREFESEVEARRHIRNLNPFSDRYVVQEEVAA